MAQELGTAPKHGRGQSGGLMGVFCSGTRARGGSGCLWDRRGTVGVVLSRHPVVTWLWYRGSELSGGELV